MEIKTVLVKMSGSIMKMILINYTGMDVIINYTQQLIYKHIRLKSIPMQVEQSINVYKKHVQINLNTSMVDTV